MFYFYRQLLFLCLPVLLLTSCHEHHHSKVNLAISYYSQAPESIMAKINILGQQEHLIGEWLVQNLDDAKHASKKENSNYISIYSNQSVRQGTSNSALHLSDVIVIKPDTLNVLSSILPKKTPILATTVDTTHYANRFNLFGYNEQHHIHILTKQYNHDLVAFLSLNNVSSDLTVPPLASDIAHLRYALAQLQQQNINKVILASQYSPHMTYQALKSVEGLDIVLSLGSQQSVQNKGHTCYATYSNHFNQLDRLQIQFPSNGEHARCQF